MKPPYVQARPAAIRYRDFAVLRSVRPRRHLRLGRARLVGIRELAMDVATVIWIAVLLYLFLVWGVLMGLNG